MSDKCNAYVEYDIGSGGVYSDCRHMNIYFWCDGQHEPEEDHRVTADFCGAKVALTWPNEVAS